MNRKISADTIVMAAAIGACVLFLAATACFGEKNFFTFLCYGFGGLMIILILAVYGIFRKAFISFRIQYAPGGRTYQRKFSEFRTRGGYAYFQD